MRAPACAVTFGQCLRGFTERVLHVRVASAFQALSGKIDALHGVTTLYGDGFDVHVLHAQNTTGMTAKCQGVIC